MYQSIPSHNTSFHPIPLWPASREFFWMGKFYTSGHKESAKPLSLGKKNHTKPHPQGKYFHKFRENKKLRKIIKNSKLFNSIQILMIISHP